MAARPGNTPLKGPTMKKKTIGAVAAAAAVVLALSACGGGSSSAEVGQGRNQLLALGRQPAPRLPAVRRRLHQGQPGHHRQDHPARLGRLLEHPHQRLRGRHRTGRLHQPPRPSTREFAENKQLLALDDAVDKDNVDLAPTTRASRTSGWARTASATACPRTGTPSACSTTRPWPTAAGVTRRADG